MPWEVHATDGRRLDPERGELHQVEPNREGGAARIARASTARVGNQRRAWLRLAGWPDQAAHAWPLALADGGQGRAGRAPWEVYAVRRARDGATSAPWDGRQRAATGSFATKEGPCPRLSPVCPRWHRGQTGGNRGQHRGQNGLISS